MNESEKDSARQDFVLKQVNNILGEIKKFIPGGVECYMEREHVKAILIATLLTNGLAANREYCTHEPYEKSLKNALNLSWKHVTGEDLLSVSERE